jgi:hypothetical protein
MPEFRHGMDTPIDFFVPIDFLYPPVFTATVAAAV